MSEIRLVRPENRIIPREGPSRMFCSREEVQFRARRREIYGQTKSHADLDHFDALGMDIIEGRG